MEEITSSIDAKKISIGVFIDLKKAFDTVNHDLLIDKLEYYGIRGIAQEWLKSYLKDRKQFVQIDECASTLLSVTCGVPQGSILGPKLFIVYINDICNASSILKFILFADDTNVFYSGVDIQTLCECISRELNKLHIWLSVNKLSLNVDKTNYILFGNRKYIDNVCISMNNSIITRVRATKFLGVIIDEKLTWKDHISLVRSKLAKTVVILYRVRYLLNRSALFILYCSLFLPYLTYCAEIWGNTYKSNIQCIFLLQKKIVRIVYGANFKDHTDVIFQDLNFLKFYDLVKLKTCEVMYRAFNKTLPVNLNNIFTVCESNCLFNMRKKKDFVQKYTRTNIKAMSVSVIGAKLWNELDSDLRHIKNILLFKKKLKWGILPTYVSHVTWVAGVEKRSMIVT